jgi:nucleoside-diphosphate-sugar epimerase
MRPGYKKVVVMTGASSFTGYWFCKSLIEEGYKVTCFFTQTKKNYSALKKERINLLYKYKKNFIPIFNAKMGSKKFLKSISSIKNFIFIHHGAYTIDYNSNKFDLLKAINDNNQNINLMFDIFKKNSVNKLIYTSTIFQGGKKNKPENLYGLSKDITQQIFKYICETNKIKFKKFIIANPFGPFEEKRFLHYVLNSWKHKKTVEVKRPKDVVDYVQVQHLANQFVKFIKTNQTSFDLSQFSNSNLYFLKKIKRMIIQKNPLECKIKHKNIKCEFNRINSTKIKINKSIEKKYWSEYFTYYDIKA